MDEIEIGERKTPHVEGLLFAIKKALTYGCRGGNRGDSKIVLRGDGF